MRHAGVGVEESIAHQLAVKRGLEFPQLTLVICAPPLTEKMRHGYVIRFQKHDITFLAMRNHTLRFHAYEIVTFSYG